MLGVILVLLGLVGAVANREVTFEVNSQQVVIDNGYVKALFETGSCVWMSELYGDFKGLGVYGENLLASGGLRLERENADGSITSAINAKNVVKQDVVHKKSGRCSEVHFPKVKDDVTNPTVEESWTFSLCEGDRTLRFDSAGSVLAPQSSQQLRTVRHTLHSKPLSTTAFFDQGVVQIKNAKPAYSHFASSDRLQHTYVLGGVGAIDILRPQATGGEEDQVVLLNSAPGTEGFPYSSGFQEILVGTFSHRDYWVAGSSASDVQVNLLNRPCRQHYLLEIMFLSRNSAPDHRPNRCHQVDQTVADLPEQPQLPLGAAALGHREQYGRQ